MKKLLHNNQVIITSLAIMIAIAGYLNFSNNNSKNIGMSGEFFEASEEVISNDVITDDKLSKDKKDEKVSKVNDKEITDKDDKKVSSKKNDEITSANEDLEKIGEAVLVNSNITLDYFYTVKLNREQTRAKNKEELIDIVENQKVTEEEKEVAVNKIVELTAISERENASEMMLEAKGFKNTVVSIVNNKADVIVEAGSISEEQVAQIVDVVNRKTGIEISNIVVTPVNANEKSK